MPISPILRSFIFGAVLLALCLLLSVAKAQKQPIPERAVAILYDDSGSMGDPKFKHPTRWIFANQAIQSMGALLQNGDELYWATMNLPDIKSHTISPGGSSSTS